MPDYKRQTRKNRDAFTELERIIRQRPYLENRLPDLREAATQERIRKLAQA